jgi:hypothetical protein
MVPSASTMVAFLLIESGAACMTRLTFACLVSPVSASDAPATEKTARVAATTAMKLV